MCLYKLGLDVCQLMDNLATETAAFFLAFNSVILCLLFGMTLFNVFIQARSCCLSTLHMLHPESLHPLSFLQTYQECSSRMVTACSMINTNNNHAGLIIAIIIIVIIIIIIILILSPFQLFHK